MCLVVGLAVGLVLFEAHAFLAVTERVESEVLVIEGWAPNYALEEGIAEFKNGRYRLLLTTGCTILNGVNLEPGDNHAGYAVARLKWLGMDPALMKAVPAEGTYRNRTYLSAVALARWFEQQEMPVKAINLLTVGTHARRSRLLFEQAFQGRVRVGIIAVEDREYEAKRWWRYSEGVKEVISEGVAYLYARFVFRPGDAGTQTSPQGAG